MRILHIFDHSLPLQSGYVYRSLGLLKASRNLGIETFHLTSSRQNSGQNFGQNQETQPFETVDGWDFFRTPNVHCTKPVLKECQDMYKLYKRIVQVIEQVKPYMIHVHSPVLNFFPAYWAAKKYHLPVVYEIRAFWEDAAVDHGTTTENSVRYKATKWLETQAVKKANHVFTICQGLKDDLISRGIKPKKITIIPNAVDADRFQILTKRDTETEQKLNLQGKTVLGFIGSFYGYEGLDHLVGAMPFLLEHHPDIRLLLVGGGVQENAIKQQIQSLNLQDSVIMTGRAPHGEVEKYYSLCDALVFPRHKMRLTDLVTPLKPLESMAMGNLVMASDIGGHRELIQHKKAGFLLRNDSPKTLAQGIVSALQDKSLWNDIIQNGRQFVQTERNWKNSASKYCHIYNTFLK